MSCSDVHVLIFSWLALTHSYLGRALFDQFLLKELSVYRSHLQKPAGLLGAVGGVLLYQFWERPEPQGHGSTGVSPVMSSWSWRHVKATEAISNHGKPLETNRLGVKPIALKQYSAPISI